MLSFFLMFILMYSQDFRQLIRGLREILISAARFTMFLGENSLGSDAAGSVRRWMTPFRP